MKLEYITVDIMSDHSEQEKPEGSDSTNLHLLTEDVHIGSDAGGATGSTEALPDSSSVDVSEPGITANLQSHNRTTDEQSESDDGDDDVNLLSESDSEDQQTVIEASTKNTGAAIQTQTEREKGEKEVATGEKTDQETEETAEATAEATARATEPRGSPASAKDGRKLKKVKKKRKNIPKAPTRQQPHRTSKATAPQHKTGQSDTPTLQSLGHVSTTGNTDSGPREFSRADMEARSNMAFILGRLSASGEAASQVGAALTDLSAIQSSLPQEMQFPEKGGRLPPSYDEVLKEAKRTSISVKLPSLSDKLAALKQKTASILEERPGFEAIINPHGPENPHREWLNAVAPPREYTVCMADDPKPQPAEASVRKNIKLTPYESHQNPVQWWDTYEAFAIVHGYKDEDKIKYLKFHLSEDCQKWYYRMNIGDINDLAILREAFLKQYTITGPSLFKYKKELYDMRQGKDSCSKFAEKVMDACRRMFKLKADEKFSDDQFRDVKDIILDGTNPTARDHLVHKDPKDVKQLVEACELANYLEKHDRDHGHVTAIKDEVTSLLAPIKEDLKSIKAASNIPNEPSPKKARNDKANMNDLICTLNNFTKSMGNSKGSPDDWMAKQKCHQCGGMGHFARSCPNNSPRQQGQWRQFAATRSSPGAAAEAGSENRGQSGYSNSGKFSKSKFGKTDPGHVPMCQWCQKKGHVASTCYELEKMRKMQKQNEHNSGQNAVKQKQKYSGNRQGQRNGNNQ